MILRLNNKKYRYKPTYTREKDRFSINKRKYLIQRKGFVLHNEKWEKCYFYISELKNKTILFVSPHGLIKNGMSNIGQVNEQGNVDEIKLSLLNRILITIFDILFLIKIIFLKLKDRITPVKTNIILIFIAIIGSTIYFLINHYYDNYLQELINKSNIVQSFIVLLSLSSLINIFHPFTFRKELKIDEVDDLITKKNEKEKDDLEHEKYVKKNTQW